MLLYLRHGVNSLFLVERILWLAALIAEVLVILKLVREGLVRKYPLFLAFLAADSICSIVLMQINIRSFAYSEAFRTCTLIMIVFRLGVAGELYERICEHFPGIGAFRIGLAAALLLLASLVTVFTFRPNLVAQWAFPRTIAVAMQRYQSEIFAGCFVLTWIFLRYVLSIRQPFQPNVLSHWRLSTIYFGVSGAAYLAVLLTGRATEVLSINCAMLAVQLGCFVAWFRLMCRSGEAAPEFPRLSPNQIASVEHYNQELLRTVRSLPGEVADRKAGNQGIPLYRARLH